MLLIFGVFGGLGLHFKMASNEEFSFATEWESEEREEETSGSERVEGEEAGRGLKTNDGAWTSCDKLKADNEYHNRYIPLKEALSFRDLSTDEKETFVNKKGLADEDKMFLSSEEAVQHLKNFSDAVVCITVKLTSIKKAYGTGFLVRVNNQNAVITNSHSIRKSESDHGVDFRLVQPSDVSVYFFHDGKESEQISRKVTRIESASPPDKNKAKNVLLNSLKGQLLGDDAIETPDINKCDIALGLLSSYFNRRDAFLDYALLYLKPLENDKHKTKFESLRPLEMKEFTILDNFRNVSSFEFSDPRSSKYPRSLRLFTISHPHQASKQVSFGGMVSNLTHVYFLNMTYGQNDTGMLGGKEPFAEHSIATCKGSSGAPIFFYIFNHDTGKVVLDEGVYFLHFFGHEVDGKLRGKAVSFSSVIRNLQLQAMHKELAEGLAEVRENTEDSS